MNTFLKLLLAGALAGLLFTLGRAAAPAFTNVIVGALIAWTLVQYTPARPRWQPKLRALVNRHPGATDVPLRFPAAKPRPSVPAQLTLAE